MKQLNPLITISEVEAVKKIISVIAITLMLQGCGWIDFGRGQIVKKPPQWQYPNPPDLTIRACSPKSAIGDTTANWVCMPNEDAKTLRIWLQEAEQEARKHGAVVDDQSDTQ